jgi:polar amino acid transport system substrate-binding protein
MKEILIGFALALMASGAAHAADLGGKLLKVGSDTTSPPMESVDTATGQIVGFDVDVVNAICAKINCKAEFVTTGWDGIFAALDQGSFDLVASGGRD